MTDLPTRTAAAAAALENVCPVELLRVQRLCGPAMVWSRTHGGPLMLAPRDGNRRLAVHGLTIRADVFGADGVAFVSSNARVHFCCRQPCGYRFDPRVEPYFAHVVFMGVRDDVPTALAGPSAPDALTEAPASAGAATSEALAGTIVQWGSAAPRSPSPSVSLFSSPLVLSDDCDESALVGVNDHGQRQARCMGGRADICQPVTSRMVLAARVY